MVQWALKCEEEQGHSDQGKGTKESSEGRVRRNNGMGTEGNILWHIAMDFALIQSEQLPCLAT